MEKSKIYINYKEEIEKIREQETIHEIMSKNQNRHLKPNPNQQNKT